MERRRRTSRPQRRHRVPSENLRSPVRLAQLLARACAVPARATGERRDEPDDPLDRSTAAEETDAAPEPLLAGDDDDDAERLEEENDDDEDDVADENAADDSDARGDDDGRDAGLDGDADTGSNSGHFDSAWDDGTLDDTVEALTAALDLAAQVVDVLKRQLLAKTVGDSAAEEEDERASAGRSSSAATVDTQLHKPAAPAATFTSSYSPGEPGVPRVRARAVSNSHCKHCNKSFNAFHRSRHCTSCGYSFCVKCVSRRQVLPSAFGFKDEAVRVCELCYVWFQKALECVFETLEAGNGAASLKGHEPTITTTTTTLSRVSRRSSIGASGERVSSSAVSPASPDVASGTNDEGETSEEAAPSKLRRRQSRHSITAPATQKSVSKAWYSGHLRAMHVSDRLPRKKTRSDTDLAGDAAESELEPKPAASGLRTLESSGAVGIPKEQLKGERIHSTADGDDANRGGEGDDAVEIVVEASAELAPVADAAADTTSPTRYDNDSDNALERRRRMRASKRSKFSRSASFDFTNLKSAVVSPNSAAALSIATNDSSGRERGERPSDTSSSLSGRESAERTTRPPRQKCFDDSDIVDSRAKTDSSTTHHLPATVLRFAVYKIEAGESQSLRRTLGFGKANPVLDRYSLELDCSQGIVRVKSVFMHRFWSFHCDAVRSLSVGSASGTAKLVVHNGVEGNLTHELQFANDDERDEFKRAVETCRSSSLQAMRRAPVSGALPSSPPLAPSVALGSPVPDDPTAVFEALAPSESSQQENGTTALSAGRQGSGPSLLAGEAVVSGTEFPATLLVGPGGDNNEVSQAWGRIRGLVVVTNFRVAFVPSDEWTIPLRNALQGSVAYIPLFAITTVQVLYPGGRRSKASRAYSTGLPAIVVLNCKDVRVMRVQVEGLPHVSDERSQLLVHTISRLADDAQRIKAVERGSPEAMSLAANGAPPLHLSLGATTSSAASTSESTVETNGRTVRSEEETTVSTAAPSARKFIGPSPAPSPVLRPSSPLQSMPLELSSVFAFAYSIECPTPDVDGWNLFADEREFRRQINGDPSAQPFFKFYQNARGNICKTYPSKLLLPASMTSATLTKVTDFRSKNRLPVITYYHRRNRCVLTRSSQPLLGNLLSGSSSLSDQLLVGVYRRLPDIIRNQSLASASSRPIYIFDARKLKASTGNRLMGKGGVETPQDYPGAVVHHLNIANMYRMQSSFQSLVKLLLPGAVDDSDKTWMMRVESTRWLNHLHYVLEGAMKIARVLELEGSSVLVHCSDGWDRTAQLTALAQLMIDPFFRTIRGFAVLVEKDWCAFGHKFAERLGADRSKDPQRNKSSPVMLQFLDAVWQIQRQFPSAFEFNERFLLHVANSLTSGLYGTFLYDSRLQRDVNDVRATTVSVWTPVLQHPRVFANTEFVPRDRPIWPWTGIQIMRVWEGYFLQWHPKYSNCHWISTTSTSSTTTTTTSTSSSGGSEHAPASSSLPPPLVVTTSDLRDGAFDAVSGNVVAGPVLTNLPSPVDDTLPRSNPSSVRSIGRSSSSSSSRSQPAPKLPLRNVFIYRS